MSPEKAKSILNAARTGDPADDLPDFEAALALTRTNPELKAWWEREQEFNRALESHLCAVPPPPDLRDRILQAIESDSGSTASSRAPANLIPFLNWALPIAAAAAVLIAVFTLLPQQDPASSSVDPALPGLIAYLDQSLYLEDTIQLETRSRSLGELQAYLANTQTPALKEAPPGFVGFSPIGCLQVHFKGVKVGLICFENEHRIFHVFSAKREAFSTLLPEIRPENLSTVFETGGIHYKIWTDDENVNILTHKGNEEDIESFF